MSFPDIFILILCVIDIVVLICLKSYAQFREEYRTNVSIIPIVSPNTMINNNIEEEKVPDNNLYNVNI